MKFTLDYIALLLSLLYGILWTVLLLQLVNLFQSKNYKWAASNVTVMLLCISSFLRIFFWCKVIAPSYLDNQAMMVVFYLPLWLDFAALSQLAIFYISYCDFMKNPAYRNIPSRISFTVNTIFLVLDLAFPIAMYDEDASENTYKILGLFYTAYATVLDFLLSLILACFGYLFQIQNRTNGNTNLLSRKFINTFIVVNWIVVCCYTLRGIYTALLSYQGLLPTQMRTVYFNGKHPVTSIEIFLFFLITEIFPNFCVALLLWRVTTSQSQTHSNSLLFVLSSKNADNGDDQIQSLITHYDNEEFEEESKMVTVVTECLSTLNKYNSSNKHRSTHSYISPAMSNHQNHHSHHYHNSKATESISVINFNRSTSSTTDDGLMFGAPTIEDREYVSINNEPEQDIDCGKDALSSLEWEHVHLSLVSEDSSPSSSAQGSNSHIMHLLAKQLQQQEKYADTVSPLDILRAGKTEG